MDYGFGKTYTIPAKFTALNGTIQYYKLTAGVDLVYAAADETEAELKKAADAQANLLRVLEVLRTYGGQPVITKAEGKVLEFTLEQANVYGKPGQMQVSEKDMIADAVERITAIFGEAKAVDGATQLFASVEVKEAF